MNLVKKVCLSLAAVVAFLVVDQKAAQAQSVQFGGHAGAIGFGSETKVGYGVNVTFIPSDVFGLFVDGTFAKFNGVSYFSSSPSLMVYMQGSEELKFGGLIGAGFHKVENIDMEIRLNFGGFADFYVAPNFIVGVMARYQPIFRSKIAGAFFLRLSWHSRPATAGNFRC